MKLGLKVAGVIAGILVGLFYIENMFYCLNQADNFMFIAGITGLLVLIVISFPIGSWVIKLTKKQIQIFKSK